MTNECTHRSQVQIKRRASNIGRRVKVICINKSLGLLFEVLQYPVCTEIAIKIRQKRCTRYIEHRIKSREMMNYWCNYHSTDRPNDWWTGRWTLTVSSVCSTFAGQKKALQSDTHWPSRHPSVGNNKNSTKPNYYNHQYFFPTKNIPTCYSFMCILHF